MKYPDQCACGGFFAHNSKCPKYRTPAELHKAWLDFQKANAPKPNPTYSDVSNPLPVKIMILAMAVAFLVSLVQALLTKPPPAPDYEFGTYFVEERSAGAVSKMQ